MIPKYLSVLVLAAAVSVGAGAARAQSAPGPRVLVIPFTTLNVPDSQQWIAKGVQENLVADFGRSGTFSPVAFQGQVIVEDNATAVRLARQASANYAIRGAAQIVGDTVRLTAQLIDVKNGDTISTGSVTGSPNDLLRLEDELSAQLRGVSGATATATGPAAPVAPVAAAPGDATPEIIVISQPASPALGYDPGYYNSAPWYNGLYGYPGLIWPIAVPIPDKQHHHHHPRPGNDCDPTRPPRPIPSPVDKPDPLPPPVQAFRPAAGFSLPTPTTGFNLPIPQAGGFSSNTPTSGGAWSNTPTGGFSLQTSQAVAPAVRWSSPSAQGWYTPQPNLLQAPRTTMRVGQSPMITPRMPTTPVIAPPRTISMPQPMMAPRTLSAPPPVSAPRGRTLEFTQLR
jgi:TolB-like protein